ncbi:hypothetical protein JC525_09145 [Alteromonas sp. IB21]|uniref:Rap1a/Tai family immunity protein n=1 Tax=Alteromonas sp. IB21 TaxID=2779369 RepID=UPI0018E86366|nr:Rap1a/Tai family immunity protein [Alteromonas sp. IB21]MBJ2129102.1 hypothetical protein [Alteromonas sp. IB21]
MKKVILILALMLPINAAIAGFTDGNKLYQWMLEDEKQNGSFQSGLFSGYVIGVADFGDQILFCMTVGVTSGQVNAIVAKHLKNNPEKWNKAANAIVVDALREAFPCKNQ